MPASGYHILGGDGAFAAVEAKVKKVHARVEPWLWIFSLIGFGVLIWDKFEISKLYAKLKGHEVSE